jgi:ADP-ribose pyrophosphatase
VLERRADAGGTLRDYHHVRGANSVMVVARLPGDYFVMVRQWRLPVRGWSLEFPGGGLASGESPHAAARRELKEETGYAAASLTRLGQLHPCNGLSSEVCTVFLADDLQAGAPCPDDTEALEILTLERGEVEKAFRSKGPQDAVSLAAWHMVLGSNRRDGG